MQTQDEHSRADSGAPARRHAARPLARKIIVIFSILILALLLTAPGGRPNAAADSQTPSVAAPCPIRPAGPEFRVDTTGSVLFANAVAADASGNFVVVWSTYRTTGPSAEGDIYARLYDAAGVPQGEGFRVNGVASGYHRSPAVAMDADGDFVVAWLSDVNVSAPAEFNVYVKRYSRSGAAAGETRANTFTAATAGGGPSVATDASGNFVVTWGGNDLRPLGTHAHIFARLYTSAGSPRGAEFFVDVPGWQKFDPAAAMDADGDFVIAWQGVDGDGLHSGTYARHYNTAGEPKSPPFRVSTYTGNFQQSPAAAMGDGGDFVVAWSSSLQDGSGTGIYAQRFDASGARRGAEFRVNDYTGGSQSQPAVAADANGDFVVAWTNGLPDIGSQIFARRFDAAGTPQGEEFMVNDTTPGGVSESSAAMGAAGGLVVAWAAPGSTVHARRYGADCSPPAAAVQFSSDSFRVTEGCVPAKLAVSVARTVEAPEAGVSVEYAVTGAAATQRQDYTYASGRLTFAPGEATKEVTLLVNEDGYADGDETVRLTLINPSGAALGTPASAILVVEDNEAADSEANPIDDARTFVCQHYHDFLGRHPDEGGLAFWTSEIERCGADAACVRERRVGVSAAFYLSIEFQQTGYFVERLYEACLGRRPSYAEFLRDVRLLGAGVEVGAGDWERRLEANKREYAEEFVGRAEFLARYATYLSAAQYVGAMFEYASVEPTAAEVQAAVNAYGAGDTAGRAAAMRAAMEGASVYRHYYNRGFVLAEYFGYLRRQPNYSPDLTWAGYDFWLRKMDDHSLPGEDVTREADALARVRRGEMVRAFIESLEYRQRFGRP